MSSQPDSQDFSVPDSESQSSDSEAESQNSSQVSQDRPKRVDKLCRCWKFRDFIQAEVSDDSSKLRLIEFIRTRLTHNRPACVRSVTVFADLNQYLSAVSDETPTVSIAIVGCIQTKPSRKTTMKSWLSSAAWDPVSGGLYSNLDFLSNMDRANNPSVPGWCMLPIFGELGLNNDGRLAARSDRKVCVVFKSRLLNFSPPCDRLSSTEIGRQRTSRETGAAESPPATSGSKCRSDSVSSSVGLFHEGTLFWCRCTYSKRLAHSIFVNDTPRFLKVECRRHEHRGSRKIEHLPNIRSFVINLIQQKR